MYIKGVPRKKNSCLSSQKFLYPSLFLSVSLRLLCTESAFPIKDWSIFVHERHELQKSSDKIIFKKIKTAYDTKRKLHQWVLINTTKCPESDGLISALSLLFVEAATLYSSSSSEKSGPDFPRFYFHKSSDRNGNSRGVGQLLVSLVPDVDQLSESREAFIIFFNPKSSDQCW